MGFADYNHLVGCFEFLDDANILGQDVEICYNAELNIISVDSVPCGGNWEYAHKINNF